MIGKDLHLIVREAHAQEVTAVARALAALVHTRRCRAAMMAIGDVKMANLEEGLLDEIDITLATYYPRRMSHAVFGREINRRRLRGLLRKKVVEGGLGAVSEEYRAGLGIQRFDVTDAVLLLCHACQLVLFDEVPQVVLATGDGHETDLAVRAHDLAIKVERRSAVLLEPSLGDKAKKIRPALGINGRVKRVRGGWQFDFGLADAEKAEGIACGLFGCFLRRENVVG